MSEEGRPPSQSTGLTLFLGPRDSSSEAGRESGSGHDHSETWTKEYTYYSHLPDKKGRDLLLWLLVIVNGTWRNPSPSPRFTKGTHQSKVGV